MNSLLPDLPAVQPLVSVITISYNSSKYVRDAIEGVLAQTYTNIEYIIGDDCSTDNTWDIIQEYNDERIKAYRNKSNLGEYPNRNNAISLATGKYLLFIDGDDYLYPYALDFYLKHAEANQDCAIVIQKGYQNDIIFPLKVLPNDTFEDCYYGKNLLSSGLASNFFRVDVLKSSGMLSENYITGDVEIRQRIAFKYPVMYVFGNLAFSRETPSQASSKLSGGKGMLESLMYIKKLTKEPNSIISNESLLIALAHEKYSIASTAIKKIFRLKFKDGFLLLFNCEISPITYIKFLMKKKAKRNWNYSPSNPKKDSSVINPFLPLNNL